MSIAGIIPSKGLQQTTATIQRWPPSQTALPMTSIYRDALPAKTTTTYPMTELSALPIPLTVLL